MAPQDPEEELLRTEPDEFLRANRRRATGATVLTFAVARAAEQVGEIDLASGLFERVLRAREPELAARANAHLAHIDYYRGDFARGVERLHAAQVFGPLPRAEAHLYCSANLIALGDARASVHAAREARRLAARVRTGPLRIDLRFRCARQLVHVLVARGEYLEAAAEAEAAATAVRTLDDRRRRGYAAYLRGFVRASRGHAEATLDYSEAERHWAGAYPNLHGWLRVLWAVLLRELGDVVAGEMMRPRDRDLPSWEEPLFALARGDQPAIPNVDTAPPDERPFLRATRGLIGLRMGQPADAERDLAEAVLEFDRCGLDHYRRGAALTLAFAQAKMGRRELALSTLRGEAETIATADLRRWPWWDRRLALEHTSLIDAAGIPLPVRENVTGIQREPPSDATLLRARRLTEREAEVVQMWVDHPHFTRPQLAEAIGIRESSVRAHLNAARRKLDLPRRGPLGLRASIEDMRSGRKHGLL